MYSNIGSARLAPENLLLRGMQNLACFVLHGTRRKTSSVHDA